MTTICPKCHKYVMCDKYGNIYIHDCTPKKEKK